MNCKCDMRTGLVGDGCEDCNPKLALEIAEERIAELEEANKRLQGDLSNWMQTADSAVKRAFAAEAEVARWRDRYADAMAKLVKVQEWCDEQPKKYIEIVELAAILADARKPLAVVEGYIAGDKFCCDEEGEYSAHIPAEDCECVGVFMPKEDADGD
jgi:hypothetical protein